MTAEPTKRKMAFAPVPSNFFGLADEEKRAVCRRISQTLHDQLAGDEGEGLESAGQSQQ